MVWGGDRALGQPYDDPPHACPVGMDAQKKTEIARERDVVARLLFADLIQTLPVERVVVLDESSVHRDMHRLYARALVGQRAVCPATRNFGGNVSILAALRLDGIGPALAVEGAVNTAIFTTYIQDLLVPTLRPGDIVVLDNLRCHHANAVRDAIQAVGAHSSFCPPIRLIFRLSKTPLANSKRLSVGYARPVWTP